MDAASKDRGLRPEGGNEMIELVKVVVETLTKVIPNISKSRTDKRFTRIGADLFMLYVRLNEVLVSASELISSVEEYVESSDPDKPERASLRASLQNSIAQGVRRQAADLERMATFLHQWAMDLSIIDGQTYAELFSLLKGKFNALNELLMAMGHGAGLPIGGPTEDDYRAVAKSREYAQYEAYRDRFDSISTVSTSAPWDKGVDRQLAAYLDSRKPREQLASIRTSLEKMHDDLAKTFDLKGVLLAVGDSKFRSNVPTSGF
jgi:hypothetical protein